MRAEPTKQQEEQVGDTDRLQRQRGQRRDVLCPLFAVPVSLARPVRIPTCGCAHAASIRRMLTLPPDLPPLI